jgi:hypothetical protein
MSRPKRLVDVEQSLLKKRVIYITNTTSITYSALSYVWSKDLVACTHRGVEWQISAFKEENMKKTLQVVRKCGIHALWIDAYCINQNDDEEKGQEIVHMGSYYSNAYLVIVLPNGIDNMYENSVTFGKWSRHWCMWTQRVWTAPELSLAKKVLVICCLETEQAVRVKSIKERDVDKQLFPINVKHWFSADNMEIIVTDMEGYCDIVGFKSSGYLDGTSDTNDNLDNYSVFIEQTQRTLSSTQGDQNVNRWIHRIVTRECENEADRVHSILPILDVELEFVNTNNSLNDIIKIVYEKMNKYKLAEIILSTRESTLLDMTVYPILNITEDQTWMLVYINEKIYVDNNINITFDRNTGLLLENAIVVQNIKINEYIYKHREFSSSDDIFGNTAYDIEDNSMPCCVGKCNPDYEQVNLVRIGITNATKGGEFRMLELKIMNININILICCLVYIQQDNILRKVGVLLIEESIFKKLSKSTATILIK